MANKPMAFPENAANPANFSGWTWRRAGHYLIARSATASRRCQRETPMSAIPTPIEPLAVSVADAVRVSGLSRSELYRLMGAGRIRAVKHGVRTLIPMDALRALLEAAPPATILTRT